MEIIACDELDPLGHLTCTAMYCTVLCIYHIVWWSYLWRVCMDIEKFGQLAETYRNQLVQLTMVRGHDYDSAQDIVQDSIIKGAGVAHRCRVRSDVGRLLRTITFRESANEHHVDAFEAEHMIGLDDVNTEDLNSESFAYDPSDETDLRLDIKKALDGLTEDDRELARLLFIEGWTYEQALAVFSDLFTSKTELFRYVENKVKPHLVAVLAAYRRPDPVPYRPLKIGVPTFLTVEQVFDDSGYEFKPVTAQVKSHYDARQNAEILERAFREDERGTRNGWAVLKHIGNRNRTRFFTVRKEVA